MARYRTLTALVCALFVMLASSPAQADGTDGASGVVGNFEIDGNSADDSGPGDPIDWLTPPPNLENFTDLSKSKNDNSYGQGSKELEPGGWVCSSGGVPGKDDLVSGSVAFRTINVGGVEKQFVYSRWRRLTTNGDAHVDYEFNQSNDPNPACPDTPLRTDGDILMTFDTENGGSTITIRAFTWQFTGAGIGVFNELAVGTKHSTWDAAVNIAPEKSDPGLKAGAFGELALNLTDTIGNIVCGQFAGVYMKTRASTSITAALKDRTDVLPVELGNCPDAHVSKSASTLVANAGDSVTYTVTATNGGSAPATGVVVTDNLDDALTVTSATFDNDPGTAGGTGNCTVGAGNQVSCSVGTLAADDGNTTGPEPDTAVVTITVAVGTASCGTTLQNQAHVTATNEVGADADDNASQIVSIQVQCGDIEITKVADQSTVTAGTPVGFTITVQNNGPGEARGVQVQDTLPAGGLSWSESPDNPNCSISGGQLTCNFGDLASGASRSVHIVSPTSGATCGTVDNTATVTTTNDGSGTASDSITVECIHLEVSKADCPAVVAPGGFLTYTISFLNPSGSTVSNATLVDTIPAGTVAASTDGGDVSPDGTAVTWDLGSLSAGASGSRTLVVFVPKGLNGETLTNTVTFSADGALTATDTETTGVSNAGASSAGLTWGVDVDALGTTLIDELNRQDTSASAPAGTDDAANDFAGTMIPGVVNAAVVRNVSHSEVDDSESTASATIVDLNLLSGAITASTVHGVSQSVAGPFGSSYNSTGSHFQNLVVNGNPITTVAPGDVVSVRNPADPTQIIAEAVLYEESGNADLTGVAPEEPGDFSADHQVTMIRVTLLEPFLSLPAGAVIRVAHAATDADYPSGKPCGEAIDTVSGRSFAVFAEGTLNGSAVGTVQHGDAEIPMFGGMDEDFINRLNVSGVITARKVDNTACGSIVAAADCGGSGGAPYATASSTMSAVNVLSGLITCDTVSVSAESTAGGASTGTTLSATYVNCSVNGTPIGATVSPNTVITATVGGIFTEIVINEQVVNTTAPTDTEGTVNAFHVKQFVNGNMVGEAIVASAHSDAHTG